MEGKIIWNDISKELFFCNNAKKLCPVQLRYICSQFFEVVDNLRSLNSKKEALKNRSNTDKKLRYQGGAIKSCNKKNHTYKRMNPSPTMHE